MQDIDALTDAAFMALRHAIGAPTEANGAIPLAILVDPDQHDPLSLDEHARLLARLPVNLGIGDTARHPYLLLLNDARTAERALSASLRIAVEECVGRHDDDQAQRRSVCAWLAPHVVDEAPNWHELVEALRSRARVVPPAPRQPLRTLFRFWDPRLSPSLPVHLGADAWLDGLRHLGLSRWWTLDPRATLAQVGPFAPHGEPAPRVGWRIDDRQWLALECQSLSNCIAHAAAQWELPAPPDPQRLFEIARRAMAHGASQEEDALAFAHLALTVHPDFDRHPEVARTRHSGFAVAARQWDAAFIDELRRGEWSHA